jgi:hypothetical protein
MAKIPPLIRYDAQLSTSATRSKVPMTADSKGTHKFSPIHISYCVYQALRYRISSKPHNLCPGPQKGMKSRTDGQSRLRGSQAAVRRKAARMDCPFRAPASAAPHHKWHRNSVKPKSGSTPQKRLSCIVRRITEPHFEENRKQASSKRW